MEPCVKAEQIATMENQIKTLFDNHKRQDETTKAIHRLTIQLEVMNETQKSMKGDLETMKKKPHARWDVLVNAFISAIVGGLMVFVFYQIGLRP